MSIRYSSLATWPETHDEETAVRRENPQTGGERKWLTKFLKGVALSSIVGIILVLTYHQCLWCVLGIAVFSALTMNCIPLMPLVFLMSLFVLMFHAIDYQRASIRVEVPLQDIVYLPSWDDFTKYVKVAPFQH